MWTFSTVEILNLGPGVVHNKLRRETGSNNVANGVKYGRL